MILELSKLKRAREQMQCPSHFDQGQPIAYKDSGLSRSASSSLYSVKIDSIDQLLSCLWGAAILTLLQLIDFKQLNLLLMLCTNETEQFMFAVQIYPTRQNCEI